MTELQVTLDSGKIYFKPIITLGFPYKAPINSCKHLLYVFRGDILYGWSPKSKFIEYKNVLE